jgi:hypothetical protein
MRLSSALALLAVALPAAAHQVPCDRSEVWEGEMVDKYPPAAQARLTLCWRGEAATGTFKFDSAAAGWDVRAIEAQKLPDGRILVSDLEMVESHPKDGWRLCNADYYDLTPDGARMTGDWDSSDCNDAGTLDLHRVSTETPPPAPRCSPNYSMIPMVLLALCGALLLARRLRARAALVPPLS